MRPAVLLARGVLRLYPAAFRRRYAGPMLEAFEDRLGAARGRGRVAVLLVSIRSLAELALSALRERLHGSRSSPRRPREPRGNLMDHLTADLRHAFRSLGTRPAFSALVLITLAVGIGASTAVFTVVNGVLLRPLAEPDADRVIRLRTVNEQGRTGNMSEPDLIDLSAQVPSLETALGYSAENLTLTGLGEAELIRGAVVTGPLLGLLGYEMALGRDFTADDGRPGGEPLAIIGYDFWQTRLGADPEVLGRTVTLDGRERRVVGVAPPGADYPRHAQIWLPLHWDFEDCGRACGIYAGIARLVPGADIEGARAEIDAVADRLRVEYPDSNATKRFAAVGLAEDTVGDVRSGLTMVMLAVLVVLVIACANVAGILLVRGTGRAGELAVRSALGASRMRLLGQLMIESLVLAVAAGALGLGLARVGITWLLSLAPADLPRLDEIGLDPRAIAFALVAIVATTGLSGLFPAWRASRSRLVDAMAAAGGRAAGHRGESRSRTALVTAEVALSLVLLLGAGLLGRSFWAMSSVDLGYLTEDRIQLGITLPSSRYAAGEEVVAAESALRERLAALPGVRSVAAAFGSPLGDVYASTVIRLHDRPQPPPGERVGALTRVVTPGYFRTLGIPLLAGRDFAETDTVESPWVAIVSRSFAEEHYPDGQAIGRELSPGLSFRFEQGLPRRIVGVVEDVRSMGVTELPRAEVYLAQSQTAADYLVYILEIAVAPEALADPVRTVVHRFDPDVPVQDFRSLEAVVADELAVSRFYMTLLTGFAALAVALAALGLYGGVAYSVARRRRELAIRMALGARPQGVVALVLREGLAPLAVGLVVGLVAGRLAVRAIGTLLYEIGTDDPIGYALAIATVVALCTAAAAVPALRASRVPPVAALRSE